MLIKCLYNEKTGKEPTVDDCSECSKKYNFPYQCCCLSECGFYSMCEYCEGGLKNENHS